MASSERIVHLFLDTEFTDLNKPYLISLGLVDERGERRFYAELRDTWQASRCSYFVVENVLPQLEGRRDFRDSVAADLKAWIEAFEAPARSGPMRPGTTTAHCATSCSAGNRTGR